MKTTLTKEQIEAKRKFVSELKARLTAMWESYNLDAEAIWKSKIEFSQYENVTQLASDINRNGTIYQISNFRQFNAAYGFRCDLTFNQMQSALRMAAVSGCIESDKIITEDGATPVKGKGWELISK